ncbi:MAG: hypothetical protein JWM11_3361 [Planctomycetaceae bacterium]|nr:hypothetical protein [Planctomycetaceae bacterium]
MTALIEIGLLNAPIALCLAGTVLLVGRFWKQPALLHALWVLVLVKLLMPPLVQVPLPWELPDWIATQTQIVPSIAADHQSELVSDLLAQSSAGNGLAAGDVQAELLNSNPQTFWQRLVSTGLRIGPTLFVTVLCIWAIGSVIWFCLEGWRIVRFAQIFLRHARLAPKPMQRHANSLARDLGLRRCPEVWLLSAVVSPMLWSVGGRARILFPSQLVTQIDKGALATLLTHELAHYYRGDHLVRILEFVVTGLFWWHPAVWVARREIEIHEEQCCDAWVVSQFPKAPRQYANALLAAIDFLSENQTSLPAAASGLGDAPLIRQRLILIMRGAAPKSLGWMGKIFVLSMALLIPVQLRLSSKNVNATALEIPPAVQTQPVVSATHMQTQRQQTQRQSVSPSRFKDFDGTKTNLIPDSRLSNRRSRATAVGMLTQTTPRMKTDRSSKRNPAAGQADWLVWAMATAPNLLSRVSAHDDGKVWWRHFCSDPVADLSAFDISTVTYTPEGQLFVTGCRDGAIRVWDATNGQLIRTLSGHKSDVRAVAISPQGDWLASGDQAGEVRLWSVLDERSSEILANYCAPISSLAFSGDGKTVAVATGIQPDSNHTLQIQPSSDDPKAPIGGLVALWSVSDRTEIKHIGTGSPLAVIAFSADSSSLSGAEWSGRVLTWNVGSTELLGTSFIDRKTVAAAAFSSDGGTIRPKIRRTF